MPIYEYRCQQCRRISGFLILNLNEPFSPVCKHCGSQTLDRVLSRIHVRLSEETRLERLADPAAWSGLY
jgi:putative FmdB family regulatory protein